MIVERTEDLQLVHDIITTPKLFELTYGQTQTREEFEVDNRFSYLIIKEDGGEVVGCLPIRIISQVCLETHLHILPKYWGTGIQQEIADAGHKWARDNKFTCILGMAPANAVHILKWYAKIQYQPAGIIKNAVIYNGFLVSMILFSFDLTQPKV